MPHTTVLHVCIHIVVWSRASAHLGHYQAITAWCTLRSDSRQNLLIGNYLKLHRLRGEAM